MLKKLARAAELTQTPVGRRALLIQTMRTTHALLEPVRNRLDRIGPRQASCPCCGWRGRRFRTAYFYSYARRHVRCPVCGSLERHRAYATFYDDAAFPQSARVLYFAPEPVLLKRIRSRCAALITIDLASRHVDVRGDMTRLPFPDGGFDVVIQHHVLEHIPDDAAALAEVHRVLRPGGMLCIAVPQEPSLERTHDWGFPEPSKEGHFRDYGRDFGDRLGRAGFEWEARDLSGGLSDAELRIRGMSRGETLFVARK